MLLTGFSYLMRRPSQSSGLYSHEIESRNIWTINGEIKSNHHKSKLITKIYRIDTIQNQIPNLHLITKSMRNPFQITNTNPICGHKSPKLEMVTNRNVTISRTGRLSYPEPVDRGDDFQHKIYVNYWKFHLKITNKLLM